MKNYVVNITLKKNQWGRMCNMEAEKIEFVKLENGRIQVKVNGNIYFQGSQFESISGALEELKYYRILDIDLKSK